MADFNGDLPSSSSSSSRKSTTTMPKLDDDLVLNEIIARLPLKDAVRCSLLNKSFCRWISDTAFARRAAAHSPSMIFYCSAKNPKIFTRLNSQTSVSLDKETLIMGSCSGLLLIYFGVWFSHYVFNPATGKVMFVDFPLSSLAGLAVGFANGDAAHFKLVSLDVRTEAEPLEQTLFIFSVVVPTVGERGPCMVEKTQVSFAAAGAVTVDEKVRPVYANGRLFWLGDRSVTTVVFDVEKEQAMVVDGPISGSADLAGDRWLGVAGGSVQFVYASAEEIVICGYDHGKNEWAEKHRIPTPSNPSNNEYGYGEPLFYDGRDLLFLLRRGGEDGHVYVYDVVRETWEWSWNVPGWTDSKQFYFSYSSTLTKVLPTHLIKPDQNDLVHRGVPLVTAFRALCRLFRP